MEEAFMEQTSSYQLNQWEATDRILREDFNADNRKIEAALNAARAAAGNCRIVLGSYEGTGGSGENHPCTLTFDFQPLLVLLDTGVADTYNTVPVHYMLTYPAVEMGYSLNYPGTLSWEGQTVRWYNKDAATQLNEDGRTYYYIALGY